MKDAFRLDIARRISFVSIIANIALSILKIAIGYIARSSAIIADGFHSISDVISTFLALWGIQIASKTDDEDHPYGHEKLEPVMGKLLATVLFITAGFIAWEGYKRIIENDFHVPGKLAIVAAILSIVVKEWMFRYTRKGALEIDSSVLMADAWHHRSDALSSIGSLIGVIGARMGYPIFDPIASIAIGLLVAKMAVEIYLKSVKELIDTAADPKTVDKISSIVRDVNGVIDIDVLKTRIHGNKMFVDIEIAVDMHLTLLEAHDIAEEVHDVLEERITQIKHCMVHVNPYFADAYKDGSQ